MVFLHLGDLHIGKSLGEFDLIEDQKFILDQILDLAEKRHADAILIAGDIYDKPVPGESAVRLFDYFLCRLVQKEIKAFIISGNHDSDERINFGSELFRSSNIFISAKYNGRPDRVTLQDPYGPVDIWLLPFVKASQVRHFYPDADISSYDDAVRTTLENSGTDPSVRNVLAAHQFVAGASSEPQLGGSESASVQNVGLVEKIRPDCFADFDYVALGHIHSAQSIGRETIRYAGSPLKYSLAEAGSQKYVTVVTLKEKGNIKIELEPLRPMRDLRHIRGRMDQLLAKENLSSPEDFIYATLTDEDIIDNAMSIFQQYYPNTVRIDYDNSHTREIQQPDAALVTEKKSFCDLISDFYRMIYGCDISGDELRLMQEAAKEAGITDETD